MYRHSDYNAAMNTRHKNTKSGSTKRREGLLQVRVADAEKEAFGEAASLSGLALSAWVRERLRLAAAKELEAVGRSVAFLSGAKG
jgi:predicted HicB family RNase H-like nuclease